MSKSDTFENDFVKLTFNATAIAGLADNAASTPVTSLYISLHTADPGESGTQTTNETAYTNYARQALVRTSGGWTVSANQASNATAVTFPQCGATGSTITYLGIGTASSGTGKLLYSGALSSPSSLVLSNGITPQFAIGAITASED